MTGSNLERVKIDGERHYIAGPNDEPYPSVTTVCGRDPGKKRALDEWERRVGTAEAERIRDESALMGTLAHHRILNPYAIRPLPKPEVDLSLAYDGIHEDVETCMAMWDSLDFDVGDRPYIEERIVSHEYGYAGTFDMMTDAGVVTDLKTSSAIRDSHRWQIAAYFQAVTELDDYEDPERAAIVRLDPDPETNPHLEPEVEMLGPAAIENNFDVFEDLLEKGPDPKDI